MKLKQEDKTNRFYLGDKVTCLTHPGIWELVWYKEGDTTCAIQNEKYRCIVKTSTLKKVKDESK
jgi:hypothetical protein